jgi:hypothetical protein
MRYINFILFIRTPLFGSPSTPFLGVPLSLAGSPPTPFLGVPSTVNLYPRDSVRRGGGIGSIDFQPAGRLRVENATARRLLVRHHERRDLGNRLDDRLPLRLPSHLVESHQHAQGATIDRQTVEHVEPEGMLALGRVKRGVERTLRVHSLRVPQGVEIARNRDGEPTFPRFAPSTP